MIEILKCREIYGPKEILKKNKKIERREGRKIKKNK